MWRRSWILTCVAPKLFSSGKKVRTEDLTEAEMHDAFSELEVELHSFYSGENVVFLV